MCGIAGYIDFNQVTSDGVLDDMVFTLQHRGPDDSGREIFRYNNGTVGFGQSRLSVIDLSSAGKQPMTFDGYSIIYNGEIYNYQEIRDDLTKKGHYFKSESDTEVVLHAYIEWGVDCVHRFIGMFALAIYDKSQKRVVIMRDRTGVKPLYFYKADGVFLFSSELKALTLHNAFKKYIDDRTVKVFLQFGYIPGPLSIYKDTHKLEPGYMLIYDLETNDYDAVQYWNAADYYLKPKLDINYTDAKEHLHLLMKSAFNYRMIADVPVGIFLSGGYDSTAVAAILQKDRSQKLKTFTIGFEDGNSEAPFARNTARYLNTDHYEYICTHKDAQEIIPDLPYFYDEPFGDISAIPTILVSQFARKHVKVALSADGGDELLAGYNTYHYFTGNESNLNRIPGFLKKPAGMLFSMIARHLPESVNSARQRSDYYGKVLNKNLAQQSANKFKYINAYPELVINNLLLRNPGDVSTKFDLNPDRHNNPVEFAMNVDYINYLPNDILTKVDRATMSVSLEGREPFLDHRIFEFAAQLPLSYKIQGHNSKRILRDIVHEYVPEHMMKRPKTGFTPPVYKWLSNELSYLIDEYLCREKIDRSGTFKTSRVKIIVDQFRGGNKNLAPIVWRLIMFQMWYERWMLRPTNVHSHIHQYQLD